jgi:hypothetical protein
MKNNKLRLLPMPVLRALCAAIFVFASANSALAQDWRFEPIFKVGAEFDDNATLDPRTDQEVDVTGLLLEARADVYYSSPTTSFFVQPRLLSRNYNDDAIPDSDDLFLRSNFLRRAELSTVGFRVNFDDQSVRTGERADSDLEIEDPDELTNDDTGRVFRFGSRQKWRVSPYWEYQVSNVSSIGVDLDYFDARYDDVFAGLLTDYSDARLGLNYRRSLSNVTTWGISLAGRTYDPKDVSESIDGYGVFAEIDHKVSEKTRVAITIGLADTEVSGSETDPEVVGDVRFTRDLETIRFFALYRRSIEGGGFGTVSLRDSFNLNFRRRLNERISAGLGVRAYRSKRVIATLTNAERNYVQLQSSVAWYLTKSFVVEADYRYTVIDRGDDVIGGRANSNRLNLQFVYQPKTIPRL